MIVLVLALREQPLLCLFPQTQLNTFTCSINLLTLCHITTIIKMMDSVNIKDRVTTLERDNNIRDRVTTKEGHSNTRDRVITREGHNSIRGRVTTKGGHSKTHTLEAHHNKLNIHTHVSNSRFGRSHF